MTWGDLGPTIAALAEAQRDCRLCPRDCGADRTADDPRAACGLGGDAWVYRELLSHGEEPAIGPTWLVDVGGCSLRCLFCSEHHHVHRPRSPPAVPLRSPWFRRAAQRHLRAGARTLSLAGGDPCVNLLALLRALRDLPPPLRLPVVWNTNGWMNASARDALRPVVACWSVDLKFGGEACARALARTGRTPYLPSVYATLDAAADPGRERPPAPGTVPPLIIRHLLMPGHLACCTRPVLQTVAARWPEATFNLLTTYLPFGEAAARPPGQAALGRLNHPEEVREATALARRLLRRPLIDGHPVR